MTTPAESKTQVDDSRGPSVARTDTSSARQMLSRGEDPLPGVTSRKPRRLYAGPVVVAADTSPEKRMGQGPADDRGMQPPNRLLDRRPNLELAKVHSAGMREQAQAWADQAITNPSARARFANHVARIVHLITSGRSDPRPVEAGPGPTPERAGVLAESPKSSNKQIER